MGCSSVCVEVMDRMAVGGLSECAQSKLERFQRGLERFQGVLSHLFLFFKQGSGPSEGAGGGTLTERSETLRPGHWQAGATVENMQELS